MAITSTAEHQAMLLDVQALDTKLLQLTHKRNSFPEHTEVQDLEIHIGSLDIQIVAAQTQISDLASTVRKAENDVEQVVMRATKDREKLDSGLVSSSKDLEALQREIESLSIRQNELEEVELEILERLDEAQKHALDLEKAHEEASASFESVSATLNQLVGDIDNEISAIHTSRAVIVASIPQDLMDLYDKIRADLGGVGAAMLHRAQCQGCHIALDPGELHRIRGLAPEAVVRCDQCRRILVRTSESGL